MIIKIKRYLDLIDDWPQTGQHILACQNEEQMIVYQAYNHQIADYAIKEQILGGTHYSYNRMSWIKPNFLWMMYRCGWASKENQERVLAIWIKKTDFESILQQAVFSSYQTAYYQNQDQWKEDLEQKEVRLQWDPDHNPFGVKQMRRAIQLGMKGEILKTFGKQQIQRIEDITAFVKEQKIHIDNRNLDKLMIPVETIFKPSDENISKRIGVDA